MKFIDYQFIKKIAALQCVEQIWLYGSRARGDERPRSDIDLAIVCPTATPEEWGQIHAIVEEADTLLKIDCVRFDTLNKNSSFYSNLCEDYRLIYEKDGGFMERKDLGDYFQLLGHALDRLNETLTSPQIDTDQNYRDAAIQRFEFSLEAYWKTMKKCLLHEKIDTNSPREVMQKAYQLSWIDDEKVWLSMLDDRNKTSHVYDEEEAARIFQNIRNTYNTVMQRTYETLKAKFL